MLKMYRSASSISEAKSGKRGSAVIKCWIYRKRSSGGKIFAVVHDHTGTLQCVIDRSALKQSEWDAMELANPGYHTLVRDGIANEPEAEALARDLSGYVEPKRNSPSARKT